MTQDTGLRGHLLFGLIVNTPNAKSPVPPTRKPLPITSLRWIPRRWTRLWLRLATTLLPQPVIRRAGNIVQRLRYVTNLRSYIILRGKFLTRIRKTSVGVVTNAVAARSAQPPLKKVKLEVRDLTTVASSSPINSHTQNDSEGIRDGAADSGYIKEAIKPRNKYSMKDLPVPGDNRWSRGVIATITLWCSSQPNIWTIPEEKMVPALQTIFNHIYPDVKYRVAPSGSVFAIVSIFVQNDLIRG